MREKRANCERESEEMSTGSKNSHTAASGELEDSANLFHVVTWDQPQDVLCICVPTRGSVSFVCLKEYM